MGLIYVPQERSRSLSHQRGKVASLALAGVGAADTGTLLPIAVAPVPTERQQKMLSEMQPPDGSAKPLERGGVAGQGKAGEQSTAFVTGSACEG